MSQTSVIRIDLTALGHNMRVLRRIVGPSCALCPLVKADAYGLGAVPIARHLAACGADMLAVYTAAQAVELAAASIQCPILVLMPVRDHRTLRDLAPGFAEHRFHLTVHDPGQLEALRLGAGGLGVEIPVHLELDTGMSRGGCTSEVFPRLLRRVGECPALRLAGVFTHFANAERDVAATDRQMDQLDRLLARDAALVPPGCLIHAANSSATLRDRRYHKSLVRVGLAWAGYVTERLNGSAIHGARDLCPILTWQSWIVGIKTIAAGTPVGYGSTWTATRSTRIGLVPVGYADGYPIGVGAGAAPKPARVGVFVGDGDGGQPQYAPVIGSVNMDQITVDL
ncbi:MAG: alanine racemase, partial [Planctomycetota bacterium]